MKKSIETKTESQIRAKKASLRTPEEQIERLNARLGVGVGAKRERARLAKKT